MGYGIYLTGKTTKRNLFGFGQGSGNMIETIRKTIDAEVTDPLQRRLMHCNNDDSKLTLQLHPSAEDVEISLNSGDIEISAKTSGAGPGYHAMLAELLNNIASNAGFILLWDDLQVGWDDATGYDNHRDIALLRKQTVGLLKTISRQLIETGEDYRNIQIDMPIGERPITDAFASAPSGEFSRDWFVSVGEAENDEIAAKAEKFYMAWHGPDQAEYWANIGRYLMLWDLDWTAPIKDAERSLYEVMLACYDRARELNPGISIPEDEIVEARQFLEDGDPSVPPRVVGAGYRRGMMVRPLNAGWSVELPGFYRREYEAEGEKEHNYFWFADREVHFTVLSFESSEGGTTAADFVRRDASAEKNDTEFPFTSRREWLTTRAVVKDSADHHTIQAMYGISWKEQQKILVLTIIHGGYPEDEKWARTLLESVSHPKPASD